MTQRRRGSPSPAFRRCEPTFGLLIWQRGPVRCGGPLPRWTLYALRDQHTLSGPKGPVQPRQRLTLPAKSTAGPAGSKGRGMQWGENSVSSRPRSPLCPATSIWDAAAPPLDGTATAENRPPPRRRANRLDGTCRPALWDPHTGAISAPRIASLLLGSLGPLVASLKLVAAVLKFRSGDQRLISRGAGR
jgi:hypothetical protein